jgi:GTP-binding protein
MTPVIAIVGRPNVGKSTLFNRLTHSRRALVAEQPGLTRDRQYATVALAGRRCLLVDTAGLGGADDALTQLSREQARQAILEADVTLLLVDARRGLTIADLTVATDIRPLARRILLAANKAEGLDDTLATSEFHELGLGGALALSAAHGDGIARLLQTLAEHLPAERNQVPLESGASEPRVRIAIVGRPNSGKSTLVNRLLGTNRMVAHPVSGTTRDSIYVPLSRGERSYTLIDTAGVRRRSRIRDKIEKFSVVKTLQAINDANVVILLVDAVAGVGDQDANLLSFIVESGRALVIGVNKWDALDRERRQRVRVDLQRKLVFVDYVRQQFMSARDGRGIDALFSAVDAAWASASRALSTPLLTRILKRAVAMHAPPRIGRHRIKLRYAHPGGRNPPTIVIHGNQAECVPQPYRRYLGRQFRAELGLEGTPVQIELRAAENPYAGRGNPLTERQLRRRKRITRHGR